MEKILLVLNELFKLLAPHFKKEDSKEGVKESQEAIIGFNEVSLAMVEILKDGFQYSDAFAFYNDVIKNEAIKEKVMAAYDNYQKIPAEVADLDIGEGMDLARMQLNYLPLYLDKFKKEEA